MCSDELYSPMDIALQTPGTFHGFSDIRNGWNLVYWGELTDGALLGQQRLE